MWVGLAQRTTEVAGSATEPTALARSISNGVHLCRGVPVLEAVRVKTEAVGLDTSIIRTV